MRDLKAHPVTRQEEVTLLGELADQFESAGNMGDTRPMVLRSAAKRISAIPEEGVADQIGIPIKLPDILGHGAISDMLSGKYRGKQPPS